LANKILRHHDVWAALFLFLLLIFSFFPFTFGNKSMLEGAQEASSVMPYGAWVHQAPPPGLARMRDPGAVAWQTEPWLQLTRQEYVQEKTLPVWNPYQAYGTPLAANMQSQTYFPLTALFSLKHSPRMRTWYLLLRLYIAGLCAYFYSRFFVSPIPALAAGVTSMFAGYYILFVGMPHLSVEILIPAAFLCAEHLLRDQRFRSTAWFAVLILLALTGGMPESSLLLFVFTYIYILMRLLTDPAFQGGSLIRIRNLAIATCFGLGLSAILLLPFRQFMRYSFDTHQSSNIGTLVGLAMDARDHSVFTYWFPLLYGSGFDIALRNYTGLVSFFLIIAAILGISWRNNAENRNLSILTCFFGLAVLLIVLKRYGIPGVNDLGRLPLLSLVLFPKYAEALLSFAVSILCAIGLERLSQWRMSPLKKAMALGLAFLPIPIAVAFSTEAIGKELILAGKSAHMAAWSLLLPACLLVAVSLVMLLSANGSKLKLPVAVLALLSCEMLGNYFLPIYYIWSQLPTVASNPYQGAPYIVKLQKSAGYNRVFAEDNVLFPNWASAFNIFDIRDLDAMYYRKYLPFVRAFFPGRNNPPGTDMYDRFDGEVPIAFKEQIEQRLLQMSSVKYVVTMPGRSFEKTAVDTILEQNAGHFARGHESQVSRQVLAVGGEERVALGEHPPYDRLPYSTTVTAAHDAFHFSFGINPAAFPICGDGVEFTVEARDSKGKISKLFSRFIDPRHDVALRKWVDGTADLSQFQGQKIDLLLSTNGGPKGDICADWAVWSDFHFNTPSAPEGPFHLIYNKEVKIFEYTKALPRAAIYFNADVKPTENQVLLSLPSPSLDVFTTVLLNGAALDTPQADWIKAMTPAAGRQVEAAQITSYSSRKVTVEANLDRRGILVLNDSDFPGWQAEVDGKTARMVSANYMFRGVFLEPGKHTIQFDYQPRTVWLGALISTVSLVLLAAFGFVSVRRQAHNVKPAALASSANI